MVKTSVARDEKRKTSLDETVIVSMEPVSYTHLTLPTKRIV